MKARIAGTAYEVEVIPYFPEGMFAGFTDVSGKLQPGMIVYKSSDLEFIETPPKLKPDTDWEAFRGEVAKDFTVALVSSSSGGSLQLHSTASTTTTQQTSFSTFTKSYAINFGKMIQIEEVARWMPTEGHNSVMNP